MPIQRWFEAIPGLAKQFETVVPREYYDRDGDAVTVMCPCEEMPTVPPKTFQACACERYYLNTGDTVRVAGGPKGWVSTGGAE